MNEQIIKGPTAIPAPKIDEYDAVRLGRFFRAARSLNKLSLRRLAAISGISCGHLSKVERGESAIGLRTFILICDALNVVAETILKSIRKGNQ